MSLPRCFRRVPKRDVLPPSCLRVFAAVLALADAGKTPTTVADVAKRLGFRSPNAVWPILRRLRKCGLIAFEDGKGRTIRPLYRLEIQG